MLLTRTATLSRNFLCRPQVTGLIPTLAQRTFSTSALDKSRVSDVIIKDHEELKDHYDRIMRSKDNDEMTRHQNAFVWELARHSVGEEIVVYPVMEKNLPDGKETAAKDRQEHLTVKEQLYEFQKLSADDADFRPTLKTLMGNLAQHIREEEEDELPRLENSLSEEGSSDLARSFERTKMFVPTRSHPGAPDRPPFETAAGLLAAPIDKIMDAFHKFPKGV